MLAADTASTGGTMSSAVTRLTPPGSRRATPAAAIAAVADEARRSAVARSPAIGPGHARSTSEPTNTDIAAVHRIHPASPVRRATRTQTASAATLETDIRVMSGAEGWGREVTATPVDRHRPRLFEWARCRVAPAARRLHYPDASCANGPRPSR